MKLYITSHKNYNHYNQPYEHIFYNKFNMPEYQVKPYKDGFLMFDDTRDKELAIELNKNHPDVVINYEPDILRS